MALGRGLPFVHACSVARISYQTFCTWRDRSTIFRKQIETAIAKGVLKRLKAIEKAGSKGDWRASAWLLEHCQPEHFAKTRIQVEAVGQFDHAFVIPRETLDKIAEFRARHERELTNGSPPASLPMPQTDKGNSTP